MSDKAAGDYDQLKQASMNRYDLTEEGCRTKFRNAQPQPDECSGQFVIRLRKLSAEMGGYGWRWHWMGERMQPAYERTIFEKLSKRSTDTLEGVRSKIVGCANLKRGSISVCP